METELDPVFNHYTVTLIDNISKYYSIVGDSKAVDNANRILSYYKTLINLGSIPASEAVIEECVKHCRGNDGTYYNSCSMLANNDYSMRLPLLVPRSGKNSSNRSIDVSEILSDINKNYSSDEDMLSIRNSIIYSLIRLMCILSDEDSSNNTSNSYAANSVAKLDALLDSISEYDINPCPEDQDVVEEEVSTPPYSIDSKQIVSILREVVDSVKGTGITDSRLDSISDNINEDSPLITSMAELVKNVSASVVTNPSTSHADIITSVVSSLSKSGIMNMLIEPSNASRDEVASDSVPGSRASISSNASIVDGTSSIRSIASDGMAITDTEDDQEEKDSSSID